MTGIFKETGQEGLSSFYGQITEPYISKLEWPSVYNIYSEMWRRDPTLRSIVNAVKLLARQAEWAAEPASDGAADREPADFLESCLDDMSHTVNDFIDDALSFLPFGWSSFEICYKRRRGEKGKHKSQFDDNKIGWRKFAFRRQSSFDRWEFDETGGFAGWWQRPAPDYKEIFLPIEKLLHFTAERDGNNPEGVALFESAYEPWHFATNLQIICGIGWQRAFVGLPKFKFESKPSTTERSDVQAVGEGLSVDKKQYVSLPPGVDMRWHNSSSPTSFSWALGKQGPGHWAVTNLSFSLWRLTAS